jgi:heme-degrading monooxygenase HmoA
MIATTPNPPYYAVIFTNELTVHTEGYEAMAEKMCEMALKEPGCLGFESVRNGLGITISYWESLEAIKNWKANTEHLEAQQQGRDIWYKNYKTRICKVERDYGFERNDDQQ